MSSPRPSDAVHDQSVKNLSETGDWSSLVRYWIVHRYAPSIKAAISRADRLAELDMRWKALGSFLKEVADIPQLERKESPPELVPLCNQEERATLRFMALYAQAVLCEVTSQQVPEQITQIGLESAELGFVAALAVGDRALAACFIHLKARGFLAINQFSSATIAWAHSIQLVRELAMDKPELFRIVLAGGLNNLSVAQWRCYELQDAITSCEEALIILNALQAQGTDDYRPEIAATLNHIGLIQMDLKNVSKSRDSYRTALDALHDVRQERGRAFETLLAQTLYNQGLLKEAEGHFLGAYANFSDALVIFNKEAERFPTAFLRERRDVLLDLGLLLLRKPELPGSAKFTEARGYLREAVNCAELFRRCLQDETLRAKAQERVLRSYELLIRTCVDLWQRDRDMSVLSEAVVLAEQSRARNLIDRLHAANVVPVNIPKERVERFHALRKNLQLTWLELQNQEQFCLLNGGNALASTPVRLPTHLDPGAASSPDSTETSYVRTVLELRDEIQVAERKIAEALEEIRSADPDYDPDGAPPTLSFAEIQRMLPIDMPTAFVQFAVAENCVDALVTTRTRVLSIRFEKLNHAQCGQLAQVWFSRYYNVTRRDYETATSHSEANRLLNQWVCEWDGSMRMVLGLLSDVLVRPLVRALRGLGLRRLVISPNRALHIFPFHACLLENGQYLGDDFEVVYTPSLSVLNRCAQRDRRTRGDVLVVGNPTGDLRFADAEVSVLRHRYPGRTELWRSAATKEALFAAAESSWLVHYSGHATFNMADQLASGLLLSSGQSGQGELLTLREVFAGLNLRRNFLTILNGCESGMLTPDLIDDYLTLPAGFLSAGAVCVVNTLWAVQDLSAALLIDRFHSEWEAGKSVAAALREAGQWLRRDIQDGRCLIKKILPDFLKNVEDTTLRERCMDAARVYAERHPRTPPFASPVHWAAFIATGLAYPNPNE
jgi:CHAT domain-containing protein